MVSLVLATSLLADATASAPECHRFDEIYASGKELCENMWNDAFVYEEDESKAYTMWFFEKMNPNDAVSRDFGLLTGEHDTCHLDYFHKDAPGPEPDSFTECHPWKEKACCSTGTVETAEKLKKGYGPEYHWDRCGPLSPECERFFVQEACFYECDPNAGLFRKFNKTIYNPKCDQYHEGYDEAHATAQDCDHNAWQMHKMPIKASYCDAWLAACASDRFCSADDGDFFTCAKKYKFVDEKLVAAEKEANATRKKLEEAKAERAQAANESKNKLDEAEAENARLKAEVKDMKEGDGGLGTGLTVLIVVLAVFACFAVSGCTYLIRREKEGKPIFGKLAEEGGNSGQRYRADDDGNGATIGNTA